MSSGVYGAEASIDLALLNFVSPLLSVGINDVEVDYRVQTSMALSSLFHPRLSSVFTFS